MASNFVWASKFIQAFNLGQACKCVYQVNAFSLVSEFWPLKFYAAIKLLDKDGSERLILTKFAASFCQLGTSSISKRGLIYLT